VAAKDCSDERRFAVLIKKRNHESDEKQVKIVTPYNKIVLKKQSEGIIVEVNGQQEKRIREPLEFMHHGHVILRVEPEDEYFVRASLPEEGVHVLFDGEDIKIKMSTLYMGRQCGICGHMDMDPNQEFLDTENSSEYPEQEFDVRRSFHKYTLKDNECQRPENYEEMCVTEDCQYNRESQPFPEDYMEDKENRQRYDMPSEFDYRQEIKPRKLNRVVEKLGKLCFSKKPVHTCPEYTYPQETKQTQELEFVCKPLSSWEAEEWRQQLRSGPVDEQSIKNTKVEFTKTVRIPTTCRRF